MPIILYESGSVMFLREECYKVGYTNPVEETDETIPLESSQSTTIVTPQLSTTTPNPNMRRDSDASILSSCLSVNSALSASSIDPTARKKLLARSKKAQKEKPRDLYRINIIFDKFTTFLMIPFAQVEKILVNENLVMKSMADGKTTVTFLNHYIFFSLFPIL